MADLEITYDPITVNSGPVTVGVDGLDNVKVDAKLAVTQPIVTTSALTLSIPDTVRTDNRYALSIPEPIRTELKTDSRAAIDLQPVVVDQCLRLSLGPLPPTMICLPNRQRLGLSLFGVEVFGLSLEGEARVVVSDLPKPPHIVHVTSPPDEDHKPPDRASHADAPATAASPKAPFVVRLSG